MEVYGDKGGFGRFSAYDTGVSELGFILESSLMACELWENIKRQPNLTLLCPASPQRIEFREDAALLGLTDGKVSRQIGRRRRRPRLLGTPQRQAGRLRRITTQKGVVANFACEMPHRGHLPVVQRRWRAGLSATAGQRISIVWSALMRSPTNSWRCRPRTLRPCCRRWWQGSASSNC